jgi:hypothetical protein
MEQLQKRRTHLRWRLLLGACVVNLILCVSISGHALELKLTNDLSVTHNEITGSGQEQSFLTEGTRYLEVFNLYGYGSAGDYEYNFNVGAKATNDKRHDPEKISLTDLKGSISNQIHTLTAGDIYEAFSQYTLNTAVKGLSYRYENVMTRLPDVTLLTGVAYSRWDNFWGTDTVERNVIALKARQHLNRDLWIALNYVESKDNDRVVGMSEFDTQTFGIDWEYLPIIGLSIRGESAWISTEESEASGTSEITFDGSAHKITAIGDGGPSRASLEYERISPDFITILGSATPDREKIKARWRYRPVKDITWNFGFLWYHDNLDGDLEERTDYYRPEIGVSVRRVFERRYSVVDFTYKFDRAHGQRNTSDHFFTSGYRDRFGIFDSETNVGVTFYDTNDLRDNEEYSFNTSLSTRKTAGVWALRPSIRLGMWTLEDELVSLRDNIWEYSLGLNADATKYRLSMNLRVGQNKLEKEGAADTEKIFANMGIYYRPEFLDKLNGSMLYLRGYINDFNCSEAGRDFRENSLTAGVNIRI